jgi:hypothetical protein
MLARMRGVRRNGTRIHCWWEYKLVQPLWKTVSRLLKKLKIDLPYDPPILLLRIYPKECKSEYNKVTCTTMFIAALFTIAKLNSPDALQLMNELRICGKFIQWEFYSAIKKNEILSFAGKWMELENIILSEVSQV